MKTLILLLLTLTVCTPSIALTNGQFKEMMDDKIDLVASNTDKTINDKMSSVEGKIDGMSRMAELALIIISFSATILFGWIFFAINDNKKQISETNVKMNKANSEIIDLIKKEKESLLSIIDREKDKRIKDRDRADESCYDVMSKVESHKLYVANNYTKVQDIEKMMGAKIDPIMTQLSTLQNTMNVIVKKEMNNG